MPSHQKTIIVGHLGRDVEVSYLPSGDAVAKFSVAVGEKWKDKKSGEQREHTEWFNCSCFGKPAEWLQRGKKGGLVFVEGKMRSKDTTKSDGSPIRYTNLIAERAFLLATLPRDDNDASAPKASPMSAKPDFDDDIPF